MTITKNEVFANKIPALVSWESPFASKIILLFHSFLHSKEDMLSFSHKLVQKGYICVSIDIDRHGDRGNYQKPFPWQHFYDVIFSTLYEIPIVLDQLEEWKGEKINNVTTLGVSMGGMIALSSPVIDKRINRVVSILSSGNYAELARNDQVTILRRFFSDNKFDKDTYYSSIERNAQNCDPYYHVSSYQKIHLLMINGTMDNVIPIGCVENFQKKLFEANDERLQDYQFIKIPGAGHELTNDMIKYAINWIP